MRESSPHFFPNNLLQVDILGLVPPTIHQRKSEITCGSSAQLSSGSKYVFYWAASGASHKPATPGTISTQSDRHGHSQILIMLRRLS